MGLYACCAIVAASCAILAGPLARGQAPPSGGTIESEVGALRAKALAGKCSEAELSRLSIFQARFDTEHRQAAAELAAWLKAGLDGLDNKAALQKAAKCKEATATADALLRPGFASLEAAAKELADTRCPICGGSGEMDCPQCRGIVLLPCARCNGKRTVGTTFCPDCQGRGVITCPTCKGTPRTPGNSSLGRGVVPCKCKEKSSSGPKALTADKARAIGQAYDVFHRMGLIAVEIYGPSAGACMKPSPAAASQPAPPAAASQPVPPAAASQSVPPAAASQPVPPAAGQLPAKLTLDLGRGVTMRLVLIPAGKFMMGSGRFGNQREVTITRPFYMGIYEVTQEQYQQVTGSNPSRHQAPKNPVESVSWTEADAFCRKLSALTRRKVSLPTQAQWEHACRAGTTTRYFFGDNAGDFDEYGWWEGNVPRPVPRPGIRTVGQQVQPVGLKKPNPWGLYDMYGNVYEWCSDWKDGNPAAPQNAEDPSGPATGEKKVLRGGSCISAGRGDSSTTTSAAPDFRATSFGFRVIVAIDDKK
jgi:formylglycine-generating enzyme required for sulfatase activity